MSPLARQRSSRDVREAAYEVRRAVNQQQARAAFGALACNGERPLTAASKVLPPPLVKQNSDGLPLDVHGHAARAGQSSGVGLQCALSAACTCLHAADPVRRGQAMERLAVLLRQKLPYFELMTRLVRMMEEHRKKNVAGVEEEKAKAERLQKRNATLEADR